MPKKSQGSKSKRTTLKQKYKLIKKVKEHHKKKRREENRKKRLGIKPKAPKDPGIPAQWPYKEELMKEIDFEVEKKRAVEEAKMEEKKERRMENKKRAREAMEAGKPAPTLEDLRRRADGAAEDFAAKKELNLADDFTLDDARAAEDNDSSRRAYYKEFVKVVEVSDVIIQVLDARDPLACRSPEVERFVRRTNPDKRVVLLLNKIDLAPKENVMAWLKYFREEMPCVAFKCATGSGGGGGGNDKLSARALPTKGSYGGAAALGGETLLQLLKNYARNRNLKTAITVGIVGFPNVGKSSLINSLKRSRSAAAVGNTPGMTKVSKEIVLDKHVKLIDSPGVIFASSLGENAGVTALRNCVKVERLADPIAPVCEILRRCPKEQLMLMYKIGTFDDVDAFLRNVAAVRGVLKKGGVPDMLAAARVVLNDWNSGRIPYYTTPPTRGDAKDRKHAVAEVVGDWSLEFDAEKVFADEENAVIAGLPELDDADVDFVSSTTAGVAQLDAAGEEAESESEEDAMEEDEESEDDEEEDEMDNTASGAVEAALEKAAGKAKREGTGADDKKASYARSKVLYGAEGQLNPNQSRAAKKKVKKIKAAVAKTGGEDDDGSDFEWEEQE
jgi:nuclear GTP-binding protein|tara:strand:- start:89 stop:1936 length:1848 start_codon:yes stop_codon:yes gene_type:complete